VNGLREQLAIDALLMGDLKSILVDKRAFMSPRLEYRLRFSVAHEIGHLRLCITLNRPSGSLSSHRRCFNCRIFSASLRFI